VREYCEPEGEIPYIELYYCYARPGGMVPKLLLTVCASVGGGGGPGQAQTQNQ
jgi:hypothetical protein